MLDQISGLCANCQFVRMVKNGRGSAFFLCERSKTDTQFVKYPTLPVVVCEGYTKNEK